MQLTINSFDGAGPRDYTPWLVPGTLKITRALNRGERMECTLAAEYGDLVVPAAGGRIVVTREDGHKLFTGYLTTAPQIGHLGVQQAAPVHQYRLAAADDATLLDRKRMVPRPAFLDRTAGAILRELLADFGGALGDLGVAEMETVPRFAASQQLTWSEHARRLATQVRGAFRAFDGEVSLQALDEITHEIAENEALVSPQSLAISAPDRLCNDVIMLGRYEPRAYVKDYFIGDGLTLAYTLSQTPFSRRSSTLLEEEFSGTALDPRLWTAQDPGGAFSVNGGRLQMNGGPVADGDAYVRAAELIELGGALNLQHGEVEFTAASDGVIGGLYTGTISRANCKAGFRVGNSGGATTIRALVNGSESGATITTVAGRRYALSTRIYAAEADRRQQVFHSSVSGAGSGIGGDAIPSDARFILEVHEIDPVNPGSLGAASTVLYDGVLTNLPTHCVYAIASAGDLRGNIRFVRLLRMVGVEVRSMAPSQAPRTRLAGSIAEGAECVITQSPQLIFFSPFVPAPNETIVARYRATGPAIARRTDSASIAAHANGNDDGVRTSILRIVEPAARNSRDCERAAAAFMEDSTQAAWQGSYECCSDFLPNGPASDPLPGDAVIVSAPSRAAGFTATLREVEMEVRDAAEDRSIYTLRFANDAADPLAWEFDQGVLRGPLEEVIAGEEFLAALPDAEITAITSTTITVDAGVIPPAGGGIEVRRTDFAWGAENDRNLIGRFTTQVFTLPRLARIQTYCIRQFDVGAPRRYSRHATALHVDYPF